MLIVNRYTVQNLFFRTNHIRQYRALKLTCLKYTSSQNVPASSEQISTFIGRLKYIYKMNAGHCVQFTRFTLLYSLLMLWN